MSQGEPKQPDYAMELKFETGDQTERSPIFRRMEIGERPVNCTPDVRQRN
jgi:hypothetical protein